MKKFLFFLLSISFTIVSIGQNQNVGINTNAPDASAVLDVFSNNKGILIPRLSTVQRDAIIAPANGLMVFDLDLKNLYFYDATTSAWLPLGDAAASAWGSNGDDMYNLNPGNIGIGIVNPEKALHVKGNGTENSAIAISNSDEDFAIIIEIDETNDEFDISSDNGVTQNSLIHVNDQGYLGVATASPNSNVDIRGNASGSNTAISMTNDSGDKNIIIEIDETNDGIGFVGTNNGDSNVILFSDATGKIGIGTTSPETALHISSDADHPSIKLSQTSAAIEYTLGYDANTDGFAIVRDDNVNTPTSILSADNAGEISLTSDTEINLVSPVVSAETVQLETLTLENVSSGVTSDIILDAAGNIEIPGIIKASDSYLDFGMQAVSVNSAVPTPLVLSSNGILNASPIYNVAFNTATIEVEQNGIYEVSYSIGIDKPFNGESEIKVEALLNGTADQRYTYYFNVDPDGKHTFSMNSRIINLNANDVLTFEISILNYTGANQSFNVSADNSYITFKKISD